MCSVVDTQYFNCLISHAINDDVRQRRKDDLPRAFLAPWPAPIGSLFQSADRFIQLAQRRLAITRVVVLQVVAYRIEVGDGEGCPANARLRPKHLFKAGVHLFFFDALASVGLRNSRAHGGAETRLILDEPQGGIDQQPLGIGPGLAGQLRDLRLLFRSELEFHATEILLQAGSEWKRLLCVSHWMRERS